MSARPARLLALLLVLAIGPACGTGVDLQTDLEITDVFTGWYDNGVKDGQNHMLPSITFRLKNVSDRPIAGVQLMVSFWRDGADGEQDSSQVRGIGDDALAPGAETEPLLVRASVGYTLSGPRDAFFQHSMFLDFSAKLFARRGGRIVPVGEFPIDRVIIPQASSSSSSGSR